MNRSVFRSNWKFSQEHLAPSADIFREEFPGSRVELPPDYLDLKLATDLLVYPEGNLSKPICAAHRVFRSDKHPGSISIRCENNGCPTEFEKLHSPDNICEVMFSGVSAHTDPPSFKYWMILETSIFCWWTSPERIDQLTVKKHWNKKNGVRDGTACYFFQIREMRDPDVVMACSDNLRVYIGG